MLVGCVSKPDQVLHYEQFMSSRVNTSGDTEFAFILAWRWDGEFIEKWRDYQLAADGYLRTPRYEARDLLRPTLTTEQRLHIEEDAVRRLPGALRAERLCSDGHRIDDVIWEVKHVRIMGQCLIIE
ncbi:hypothetical protein [Aestuariibacter salexigens]|uniref:hypothetical protein n=1 Tax=Aestuariibacter salexigens TaxID=226010 RepID=UPI000416AA38|nr:hypothetical protein [Aestuariibacter salexigens]